MVKKEVINLMNEDIGLSKKDCESAYNSLFKIIRECLVSGNKHTVQGFGTFGVADRKERHVLANPKQPELGTKVVPAHKAPKFKAAKALKELLK